MDKSDDFDEYDSPEETPDESFADEDVDTDDNPGLDMEVEEIEDESFDDTFDDEVGDEPGPEAFRLKKPMVSVLKQTPSQPPDTVTVLHGASKGNQGKIALKDLLPGKRRTKRPPGCCQCTSKSKCMKCPCAALNGCTEKCRSRICQYKVLSLAPMGSTEEGFTESASYQTSKNKAPNQQAHKKGASQKQHKAPSHKQSPHKDPSQNRPQTAAPKDQVKIAPKWTPTELAIQRMGFNCPRVENMLMTGVPADAPVAHTQHIIITMEPDQPQIETSLDYTLSPAKSPAQPFTFVSPPPTTMSGVDKSVLPPSPPSEDGGEEPTMHIEIIVMSEDESLHGLTDEDMEEFDEYIVTAEGERQRSDGVTREGGYGANLKEATPPPPQPIKIPRKALPKSFKQRRPKPENETRGKQVILPKPEPAKNILKTKAQRKSQVKSKPAPANPVKPKTTAKSGKSLLKTLVTSPAASHLETTPKSSEVQRKTPKTQVIDMSSKRTKVHDEPFDLIVETAMSEPDEDMNYSQDEVSEDDEAADGDVPETPETPDLDMSAEQKWDRMIAKTNKIKSPEIKPKKVKKEKPISKVQSVPSLVTPKIIKDTNLADIKLTETASNKSKVKDLTPKEPKLPVAKSKTSKSKENKVQRTKLKELRPKETKLGEFNLRNIEPIEIKPLDDFDENDDDIAETIIIRHNSSPSPQPRYSKKGRISIRDIISPKNYLFNKKNISSKSKSKSKHKTGSVKKVKASPKKTVVSELPKFTNTNHPAPSMERKRVMVRHCVAEDLFEILNNPSVDTPKSAMSKSDTPKSRAFRSSTQKKETPKSTNTENIYSRKYSTSRRAYTPRPSSTRAYPVNLEEYTPTQPGSETPNEKMPISPKKHTPKSSPKQSLTPKQTTPKSMHVRPLSSRGLSKMLSPPIAKGSITPIKRPITKEDLALIPRRNAKISSPVPEARIVNIVDAPNNKEMTMPQKERGKVSSMKSKKGGVSNIKQQVTPKVDEKDTMSPKRQGRRSKGTPASKGTAQAISEATTPAASNPEMTSPKGKRGRSKTSSPQVVSPKGKRGRSKTSSPQIVSSAKTPTPGRGKGRPGKNSPKTTDSARKRAPFLPVYARPVTRRASNDGSTGAAFVDLTEEQPRKARTPAASLLKKAVKRLQKSGHKPPSPEDQTKMATPKHKSFQSAKSRSLGKSRLNVSMFRNIVKEGIHLSPSVQKQITKETLWQPQVEMEESLMAKGKHMKGSATKRTQAAKREAPATSPPRKKLRGEDITASPKLSTPNTRHVGPKAKSPGSNLKSPVSSTKSAAKSKSSTPEVRPRRSAKSPTPEFKPIVTSVTSLSSTKSPTPVRSSRFITIKSPLPSTNAQKGTSRFSTLKSPPGRQKSSHETGNEKGSGKMKSPIRDILAQGSRFAGRLSPPATSSKHATKNGDQGKETNDSKGRERRSSLTKPKEVTKEDAFMIKKRLESKLNEGRFESRESRLKQTTQAKPGVTSGKSVTVKPMQSRALSPPKMSSPLLELMREARGSGSETEPASSTPKPKPSRLKGTNKKAVSGKTVARAKISPQKISSRRSSSSSGKSSPLPVQSKQFHKGSPKVQKGSLQTSKDSPKVYQNTKGSSQTTPSQKPSKSPTYKSTKPSAVDLKSPRLSPKGPLLPFKLRTEDAPILTDDIIEQAIKTRPGAIPRAVGRSRARQLLKKAAARQNERAARVARVMQVHKGGAKKEANKDGGSASSSGTENKRRWAQDCGFRVGQRLEAVDKNNAEFTCVASVADLKGDRLRVHFDGWEAGYDFWCRPDSQYIHPVGWCQANAKPLSPPQDWTDVANFTWEKYLDKIKASPAPVTAFKRQSKTDALIRKVALARPPPASLVQGTAVGKKKAPSRLACPKHMRCVVEVDRLRHALLASPTVDLRKIQIITTKHGSGKGRRLERRPSAQEEPVTSRESAVSREPVISPVITGVSSITAEMFQDASVIGEIRSQTQPSKQQDNIFDMLKETVLLGRKSSDVSREDTTFTASNSEDNAGENTETAEYSGGAASDILQKTVDSSHSSKSRESTSKGKSIKKRERRKSADAVTDKTESKSKRVKRRLSTSEERNLSESLEHQMSFDEDSNESTTRGDEQSAEVVEKSTDPPKEDDAEKATEQPMDTESSDNRSELSSAEKEEQLITSTSSDADDGVSSLREGMIDANRVSTVQETVTRGDTSDSENTVSSTEPNICEERPTTSLETGSTTIDNLNQESIADKEKPKERNIFEKLSERPLENTDQLATGRVGSVEVTNSNDNNETEQMDESTSSYHSATETEEFDLASRFLNRVPAVKEVKDTLTGEESADSVSIDPADEPHPGSKSETDTEVLPKGSNEESEEPAEKSVSGSDESGSCTGVTETSPTVDRSPDETDTADSAASTDKPGDNVESEISAQESGTAEESIISAEKSEETKESATSADKVSETKESATSADKVSETKESATSADKVSETKESATSADKVSETKESAASVDKAVTFVDESDAIDALESILFLAQTVDSKQSTSEDKSEENERTSATSTDKAVTSADRSAVSDALESILCLNKAQDSKPSTFANESEESENTVEGGSSNIAVTSSEKSKDSQTVDLPVDKAASESAGKPADDSVDEMDTCDIMLLPELAHFLNPPVASRPKLFSVDLIRRSDTGFQCVLCETSLVTSAVEAVKHVTEKHTFCTVCSQTFKEVHLFQQHVDQHTANAELTAAAKHMEDKALTSRELTFETRDLVSQSAKDFRCLLCGEVFRDESAAGNHVVHFHLKAGQ